MMCQRSADSFSRSGSSLVNTTTVAGPCLRNFVPDWYLGENMTPFLSCSTMLHWKCGSSPLGMSKTKSCDWVSIACARSSLFPTISTCAFTSMSESHQRVINDLPVLPWVSTITKTRLSLWLNCPSGLTVSSSCRCHCRSSALSGTSEGRGMTMSMMCWRFWR